MKSAVVCLLVLSSLLSATPVAAESPVQSRAASVPLRPGPAPGSDHEAPLLLPGHETSTGIAAPDAGAASADFVVKTSWGVETGLELPVAADEPSRASDGALVYQGAGGDASVTVRAVDVADHRLAVALQAVIELESATAPRTYAFPLEHPPGGSVSMEHDGGVSVRDGGGSHVGRFAPPWAIDAVGQPVRTWFSLDSNALVQHVEPGDQTVFPVLADPFFVVPALVIGGRTLLQLGATAASRAAAASTATASVAAVARLSPGVLTARPLSLVAKARFDRVLNYGVRHYYTRGDARAIFEKITEGGRSVGPSTRVATNGRTATLYGSTSTSVPTIQVNTGTSIYKVRIVP